MLWLNIFGLKYTEEQRMDPNVIEIIFEYENYYKLLSAEFWIVGCGYGLFIMLLPITYNKKGRVLKPEAHYALQARFVPQAHRHCCYSIV